MGHNLVLLRHAERFLVHKLVGFDIAEPYIDHGRRLCGFGVELFVHDCRTFEYGGYDVVQFNCPFANDPLQPEFERYLIGAMELRAYLIWHAMILLDESLLIMPTGASG